MVIAGDAYRARMVGFLCFSGKAKVWREYCWAKLKFCHANRKLNNKVFSSVAQTFEGNYRLFDFWYSNVKAVAHQAGIKELAPMKADCVVALCLGIKGALEHTAKNAINGQLACMFCICMRGNTVYTSRWHLSFRNKNRDQDCGYTNREKSSVCLPFWIWIMLINKSSISSFQMAMSLWKYLHVGMLEYVYVKLEEPFVCDSWLWHLLAFLTFVFLRTGLLSWTANQSGLFHQQLNSTCSIGWKPTQTLTCQWCRPHHKNRAEYFSLCLRKAWVRFLKVS